MKKIVIGVVVIGLCAGGWWLVHTGKVHIPFVKAGYMCKEHPDWVRVQHACFEPKAKQYCEETLRGAVTYDPVCLTGCCPHGFENVGVPGLFAQDGDWVKADKLTY